MCCRKWSDKAVDQVPKLNSFESLKGKMKAAAAAAIHARQVQAAEDVSSSVSAHPLLITCGLTENLITP